MSVTAVLVDVLPGHRFDEGKLRHYLGNQLGDADGDFRIRQFQGGQSNPTFLLEMGEARYVLRKKPPGKLLPSAHQVEREYKIMKVLQDSDVPVPRVRLLCEDAAIIGTPFYIMDYIEGRVFNDTSLPVVSKEERSLIFEQLAITLARLHRVDWQSPALEGFGRPAGYIERQVKRWAGQYQASKTEELPAMDKLMSWLSAHLPSEEDKSIVHGDYRLGNAMFHPKDAGIVAVLDWELSTLGHPLSDLAYCCLTYHLPKRIGGLADLDLTALGIPDEESFMKSYCQEAGRKSIPNWSFFLAFSMFRSAAIAQGVYARALQGNAANANAKSAGAHVRVLADLGWQIAQNKPIYA